MAFEYLAQQLKGPEISISLFGDAELQGAQTAKLSPSPLASALTGIQQGITQGIEWSGAISQTELRDAQAAKLQKEVEYYDVERKLEKDRIKAEIDYRKAQIEQMPFENAERFARAKELEASAIEKRIDSERKFIENSIDAANGYVTKTSEIDVARAKQAEALQKVQDVDNSKKLAELLGRGTKQDLEEILNTPSLTDTLSRSQELTDKFVGSVQAHPEIDANTKNIVQWQYDYNEMQKMQVEESKRRTATINKAVEEYNTSFENLSPDARALFNGVPSDQIGSVQIVPQKYVKTLPDGVTLNPAAKIPPVAEYNSTETQYAVIKDGKIIAKTDDTKAAGDALKHLSKHKNVQAEIAALQGMSQNWQGIAQDRYNSIFGQQQSPNTADTSGQTNQPARDLSTESLKKLNSRLEQKQSEEAKAATDDLMRKGYTQEQASAIVNDALVGGEVIAGEQSADPRQEQLPWTIRSARSSAYGTKGLSPATEAAVIEQSTKEANNIIQVLSSTDPAKAELRANLKAWMASKGITSVNTPYEKEKLAQALSKKNAEDIRDDLADFVDQQAKYKEDIQSNKYKIGKAKPLTDEEVSHLSKGSALDQALSSASKGREGETSTQQTPNTSLQSDEESEGAAFTPASYEANNTLTVPSSITPRQARVVRDVHTQSTIRDSSGKKITLNNTLKAIMAQESGGNPDAVSPTGVRGSMQVTEATARSLGYDRNNATENVLAGAAQYTRLYRRFGDNKALAMMAYNVGEGTVSKAVELARQDGAIGPDTNPDDYYKIAARPEYLRAAMVEYYPRELRLYKTDPANKNRLLRDANGNPVLDRAKVAQKYAEASTYASKVLNWEKLFNSVTVATRESKLEELRATLLAKTIRNT